MPYHPGTEAYEDAIFAAVEAVILLTAAILLPWFFRRRDKHPIKGRLPFLVIITNSVLQLWYTCFCVKSPTSYARRTLRPWHCLFCGCRGLSVALIRILITQFPCAVAIVNSHIILVLVDVGACSHSASALLTSIRVFLSLHVQLSAVDTMVLRLWVFHFAYNATSAMAEVPMQMKRVETFRSAGSLTSPPR
jgi:hypothetical protein